MNIFINTWEAELETLNRGMRANGLLRDFHNILRATEAASSFLITITNIMSDQRAKVATTATPY